MIKHNTDIKQTFIYRYIKFMEILIMLILINFDRNYNLNLEEKILHKFGNHKNHE